MKQKRAQATARRAPTYTEEEKITAVTAMLTYEHPVSVEAMQHACTLLKADIKPGTLHRWLVQYREQVESAGAMVYKPVEAQAVVNDTRNKITRNLQSALVLLSTKLATKEQIDSATFRDAGVVMGIIYDKLSKLAGIDPETEEILADLSALCQQHGWSKHEILRDMVASLREQGRKQQAENEPIVSHDE